MKHKLHYRFVALLAVLLIAMSINSYSQTAPFVKVIQPSEPNIEWVAGQSYLISWTDNLSQPVLIELANFGVNPIAYTIITPSAAGSTYVWSIPEGITPGNQYRINIFSTVNQSIVDWSDNFFSIVTAASGSYINIEQPNLANIKWLRGTTQVISWMDNMPGKVKVELINDNLIAYDNAVDYTGWSPGMNEGYGFLPWAVSTTGSPSGSTGNPADIGIIGMDNPSFYLSSGLGGSIQTDRPFAAPLAIGSTFSFDWALVAGNGNPTGSKGVKLYTGGTTLLLDIKMEFNPDRITINGNPMFLAAGTKVMNLKFTYLSAGNLKVSGLGRDGIESFDQTFSISGAPDLVSFYSNDIANDANRRLYFNNLKITTPDILLADNVEGTTYYWEITNGYAFGNKYKIRVTSKVAPAIKDVSENYFEISATDGANLEMLQPNSSNPVITWLKNSTYLISWNGNGAFPVKVELFKGGIFNSTISSSVEGTTKLWMVPSSLGNGTDYSIKVTRLADGVSVTGAPFSIQSSATGGSITVNQPTAAGIEWMRGSAHLISWNPTIPGPFNIELYNSFNGSNTMLVTGVEGSTWVWNIPVDPAYPVGNYYKINVWSSDNISVVGSSLNFFKLIDYPTGGTITVLQPSVPNIVWIRGTQNLISWNPTIQGPFNIELHNITAGTNIMIKTGAVGSTWVWDIPATASYPIGHEYKINVWSSDNNSVVGSSANSFTLADTPPGGTIEVLQPNGFETLYIGLGYLISWIDNIPEPVDIFLVNTFNSNEVQLANDVIGSTWVWDVTSATAPATTYKIRVKSSLTGLSDLSNNDFTVALLPMTFSVFPNPARENVTVRFDELANDTFTLKLTDRFNTQVLLQKVDARSMKEFRISTAELPNGVYFLSVTSNGSKTVQKIMVQH